MTEYIYGGVPIIFSNGLEERKLKRREEIVRCKDCKLRKHECWCEWSYRFVTDSGFCRWGERVG